MNRSGLLRAAFLLLPPLGCKSVLRRLSVYVAAAGANCPDHAPQQRAGDNQILAPPRIQPPLASYNESVGFFLIRTLTTTPDSARQERS